MTRLIAFLLVCVLAVPALANRQFPAPSLGATLPEAAGEAIAAGAGKVFIANAGANRVAVVDDARRMTYVAVGQQPRHIVAVGFGFMTSNAGDGTISLSRDLATSTSLGVGGSGPLVADSTGAHVYMLRPDGIVVVIDTAAFTARSFDTGLRAPVQHAVGIEGLMVADASGEIRIFSTFSTSATPSGTYRVAGRPGAIVWTNDLARKLYVVVEGNGLSVVEFNFYDQVPQGKPSSIPVDARGARMAKIVGNTLVAGFSNGLVTFELGTHYTNFVASSEVRSIDVDSNGRAFALDADRNLRVFEPLTLRMDVIALPAAASQVAYLPDACAAYVSGSALAVVSAPCGDGSFPQINLQALWWIWTGGESGWGLNVAHQGNKLFATWFTYDTNGQPTWLVVSDAQRTSTWEYSGDLYRATGPAFNAPVFDPSKVTRTAVGSARFSVSRADYMTFSAKTDALNASFPLGRQEFSVPQPMCDADVQPGPLPIYQDLWWNPAESGWGLNVAHQGNVLFITWFTYDTDGKATWFVGSDIEKTGNATYSGTLYKTFGPPMTAAPWDPSKVTRMPVGNVTLAFRDDDNGTFAYTVSGISGSKAITRQVFASPVTRCR